MRQGGVLGRILESDNLSLNSSFAVFPLGNLGDLGQVI